MWQAVMTSFFSCLLCFFLYSRLSSYLPRLFLCFMICHFSFASLLTPSSVSLSYFILAVPMRGCLGKHSCMSSPFPIAILNGTFFFRPVKAMNNWKRSAIKQILLLLLVCFFILFHSLCFHARVFGKTLLHEFHISYSHTEWYLFFSDSATTSAHCVLGAKNWK